MVTFGNQLRLDFCNISRSTKFEKSFLKHLAESGVPVKVLK